MIYPPATIDFLKILSFICDILQIEGSFFMVKIVEVLDDLQLNQKIEGKKTHYIQLLNALAFILVGSHIMLSHE